jgi:hypothetical protein
MWCARAFSEKAYHFPKNARLFLNTTKTCPICQTNPVLILAKMPGFLQNYPALSTNTVPSYERERFVDSTVSNTEKTGQRDSYRVTLSILHIRIYSSV